MGIFSLQSSLYTATINTIMPKVVKPKLVILSVPKVGIMDAKVKKKSAAKPVKTGGVYKCSGTSKYWYSFEPTILCKHCKKGFHTTKDRTRHQHLHEEPQYCPHCDYRNVRQDHLTNHIRAVHDRSIAVVRQERKQVRDSDPLAIPSVKIVNRKKQRVPTQAIPQSASISCQTTFNCSRLISSSKPIDSIDDCAEIESTDTTSTKFTQTVSVIRVYKGFEHVVSNPHPSQVQDILSFKKIKLNDYQKAVRWERCGRKSANEEYRTIQPIVLPVHKSELPNDMEYLKLLVMKLGVRASTIETENYHLKTKLASLSPVDKFV